ncbi:MAG: hypothetical protein QW794_04905 [Thermosphaera sp.]
MVESYRQTAQAAFLQGALRWHGFLMRDIGFEQLGDELAVNYFAHRKGARVPNNSAFVLRFFADLAEATGDEAYLAPCAGLLTFLARVQKETGELPYAVKGIADGKNREHFQCYQYNAFQCLDLMRYYRFTGDKAALPLITKVLTFLAKGGLAEDGHARYDCGSHYRIVTYHTAVLAAAFTEAGRLGIPGYDRLASRAFAYLLSVQRSDGSFAHSQREHLLLSDQRSYPRNLAMILYHVLSSMPQERLSDVTFSVGELVT